MKARPIDLTDWSDSDAQRFIAKYEVQPDGCWLWSAFTNHGYGKFQYQGRSVIAHRLSFALVFGEPDPEITLDHLCRVRACVNPAHLEPVSSRINTLRGATRPAENWKKTHCINGHPLVVTNLDEAALIRGARQCLACRSRRNKEDGRRNNQRVMAAARVLGMSRREYVASYGWSKDAADAILSGVAP